jgi:hypothetical protein
MSLLNESHKIYIHHFLVLGPSCVPENVVANKKDGNKKRHSHTKDGSNK